MTENLKDKIMEKAKEVKIKKEKRKFSADDFIESYTARQWLDKQSPKFKQAAIDLLPNVIGMLKSTMTVEDVLDLDVQEYFSLLGAYNKRMGITPQKIDFLGMK